jgi:DNA polymerase-3 subunit alpha
MVKIAMKETDESIQTKLDDPSADVFVFFGSDNFYIHSYEEMAKNFTKEELEETNRIADQVEDYSTQEQPYIPKFDIPLFPEDECYLTDLKTKSDKYLMYLCVEGARQLKPWLNSGFSKEIYWNRLNDELKIIFEYGLSDYFLVVHDICMAADYHPKDNSYDCRKKIEKDGPIYTIERGIARGSAANCLISYFTTITGIDPVKHNLLFSRFFNAGRLTKDNISLPDIDCDFSVSGREYIINYIKYKYGSEKVGQIITFSTIKGRAAIKDIFRIKGANYEVAHAICETIPQESIIADEIEHKIKDGDPNYNILKWTMEHSEHFKNSLI